MKTNFGLFYACLMVAGLAGCGSSYNARYEAQWKEIVKSEAWKTSLDETTKEDPFMATENETGAVASSLGVGADPFNRKYQSLVSRAYFKIISEAESADIRIKADYDRFLTENPDFASSADENVRQIVLLYRKKYSAHKTMLDGLKSWDAFDEYGSDDLDFFLLEHQEVARAMHANGLSDKEIVDYLVYKLADLYHLDQYQSDY